MRTLTLAEAKTITSRVERSVNGMRDVFGFEGKEYVQGKPADLRVLLRFGLWLDLKRYRPKEVLCRRHRRYSAKARPRSNCEECWKAYEERKAA